MRNDRRSITIPYMEYETSILCSQLSATSSTLDNNNNNNSNNNNKLTPWGRVLPEFLTIPWLVKTFLETEGLDKSSLLIYVIFPQDMFQQYPPLHFLKICSSSTLHCISSRYVPAVPSTAVPQDMFQQYPPMHFLKICSSSTLHCISSRYVPAVPSTAVPQDTFQQ